MWPLWWAWFHSRPRGQRIAIRSWLSLHAAGVTAFLVAPTAAADAAGGLFGFFGIYDSHKVPLTANTFPGRDESFMDWNGTLPRIHTDAITSVFSLGIGTAVARFETSLIVIVAAFMLWLMRGLRATLWNEIFGSVFSTIGISIDKVLESAPFLAFGIVTGTAVGVIMIGLGRGTGGRTTVVATWLLGIVGLVFSQDLLTKVVGPQGWALQLRNIGTGIGGTLLSQGRDMRAGITGVDRQLNLLETGFADAIRRILQQWMLGTVIDDQPDLRGCVEAWDNGQAANNSTTLSNLLANGCPESVTSRLGDASGLEGIALFLLVIGCLGIGAWFAWCALACLFRVYAYAAFSPAFVVYGLIPGFPRRFLKLSASDFAAQLLSYVVYLVLAAVYALLFMQVRKVPLPQMGVASTVADLLVTAIVMVLLVVFVRRVAKLHAAALSVPALAGAGSPMQMLAPATALGAAVAPAASGLLRGGGGGSAASSRIQAGLTSASRSLGRMHPAAAAVGAVAGAVAGMAAKGAQAVRSAANAGGSPAAGPGGGSAGGSPVKSGGAGSGPSGGSGAAGKGGPARPGPSRTERSAAQAQQIRHDAAARAAGSNRGAGPARPGAAPVRASSGKQV